MNSRNYGMKSMSYVRAASHPFQRLKFSLYPRRLTRVGIAAGSTALLMVRDLRDNETANKYKMSGRTGCKSANRWLLRPRQWKRQAESDPRGKVASPFSKTQNDSNASPSCCGTCTRGSVFFSSFTFGLLHSSTERRRG